jgi:predicted RNA-binding protein YlqC (UPF0109 family)
MFKPDEASFTLRMPQVVTTGPGAVESVGILVLGVVRKLVSQPEQASIRKQSDGNLTTLLLTVAPQDLRTVFGKHGRTATSLRSLVRAITSTSGQRLTLQIQAEDQVGT